ncbi:MAG: DUF2283 domain-containing protein [Spirochaetota bacterium]|nr:DUF2283 domain-containing protein [Spirochaetota bacterium]
MEKLRIHYDKEMESLTVWFDDPEREYIVEELGNGIIIMKSENNEIIGFEKLYAPLEKGIEELTLEMLTTS